MKAANYFAIAACFVLVGQARAQTEPEATVQYLLQSCQGAMGARANVSGLDAGFCFGVVAGAAHVLAMNCSAYRAGALTLPRLAAEFPPTWGAGAQAFINWAEAKPERWGDFGTTGMFEALTESFPCE